MTTTRIRREICAAAMHICGTSGGRFYDVYRQFAPEGAGTPDSTSLKGYISIEGPANAAPGRQRPASAVPEPKG
jgi:hypothetical protein